MGDARVGKRSEYFQGWYDTNREKHMERTKARRQAIRAHVDAIKVAAGCADCGYKDHAVALDFDHVSGVKLGNVGTLVNRGAAMETILAEIAKCEVVCANCHRVRTERRRIEETDAAAV